MAFAAHLFFPFSSIPQGGMNAAVFFTTTTGTTTMITG
jgi:hypothetical protein